MECNRNRQILGEAARDLRGMWRDRGLLAEGRYVKFATQHHSLIKLADNNQGLIKHMADVTDNSALDKLASYPRWIHFAAENPNLTWMAGKFM